jgi:hypothetical protein
MRSCSLLRSSYTTPPPCAVPAAFVSRRLDAGDAVSTNIDAVP